MRIAYSAEVIRRAEQATGLLESGVLMQRAAAAVAAESLRVLREHTGGVYGRRVVLLQGRGDNGRDGLFACERLRARGVAVEVLDALALPVSWAETLERADLVIDAIWGLGARGGLPPGLAELAVWLCERRTPVLAVDLPSGLRADSGVVGESLCAEVTVTFGALRFAHLMEPAASRCGRIVLADIGLADTLPEQAGLRQWEHEDLVAVLPQPDAASSKYSRGVVGMDVGSEVYLGAGILAATGAVYAGAGMVRFCGPKPEPVRLALPSIVTGYGRAQAWLLGSGWGQRADAAETLARILAEGVPAVVDADVLQPGLPPLRPDVLLTPHAGELARLLGCPRGDVEIDPLGAVAQAVSNTGATVLLKGATQYVAAPGFPCTVAIPGPAWTAQAGSGDVLAGMCATYLAAGLPAPDAALTAASMQALAAQKCWGPTPPQDVARAIPGVVESLLR